jgi:hypothetical protein
MEERDTEEWDSGEWCLGMENIGEKSVNINTQNPTPQYPPPPYPPQNRSNLNNSDSAPLMDDEARPWKTTEDDKWQCQWQTCEAIPVSHLSNLSFIGGSIIGDSHS